MRAKRNTGPRVVRIGMIKGKESPAIGRRVIKTSRYPLAPDEDVRRLTRTMNTRFTSGEKIAVGGRYRRRGGGGVEGREGRKRGKDREDHETRGRDGQQSACNPRVPKARNKLLRASYLACSILGAGTMIPGAKSCGSVGKLGDRARTPKARRLLMETFGRGRGEVEKTRGGQVNRGGRKEDTRR